MDGFFGEDFFDAFDGFAFEIVFDFGMDKGYFFAGSDGKFGEVWHKTEFTSGLDAEYFDEESDDDK